MTFKPTATTPDKPNSAVEAYIGLGANLGEARESVLAAAQQLATSPNINELQLSPLYRTAPVDASGPDYINAVARVLTTSSPSDLLNTLQAIEQQHGRERPYRNAPRTLDLDLLLYGNKTVLLPHLQVPHPRMHERAFVLRPLLDLAPDLVLPQGPASELLARCNDQALTRV